MHTPGITFEWMTAPPPRRAMETGVPLFVGASPTRLTPADGRPAVLTHEQWSALEAVHGLTWAGERLALSIRGFFANGGRRCLVGLLHKRAGNVDTKFREQAIDTPDEFDLVCAPDYAGDLSVQAELIQLCRLRGGCMALLDTDEGYTGGPTHLEASENAALYTPWILVPDAGGFIPPSGHVAGVFARTDRTTGVHKPPANEVLHDVLELRDNFDDAAVRTLGDRGVNCLRSFRSRGVRIWGARTLAGPSHRFATISVRRVLLTCVRRLDRIADTVAFEPSDIRLWARIAREVSAVLDGFHRRGALVGTSPSEAYYVRCDARNNPPALRDDGQVVADIGLAIAQPAEFIVVRLLAGQAGTTISEIPNA